jgi:hypothetical protein
MRCQLYVPATFSHTKSHRYPVIEVVETLNMLGSGPNISSGSFGIAYDLKIS